MAIPPHIVADLRDHEADFVDTGSRSVPGRRALIRPLDNGNVNRIVWRPACAAAGVPAGIHLDDLRGVSATLAARQGATTRELMRPLGHSTPDMALRYQRAEAERDVAIARAMSEVVPQSRHGPRPREGKSGA